jgi:small-conductance mechanosensitive channel
MMDAISEILHPQELPGALLLAVAFFGVAWLVSKLLTKSLLKTSWVIGRLGRKVDNTVIRYIIRVKTVVVFLGTALFYASLVPPLQTLMGGLVAGASITAVVVGFAAKSTLANLVAGLGISIYRPIRIDDTVTIEGEYGYIEDITLRHTIVRTWENKRLVIPNEKLDNMSIVNHSLVEEGILNHIELKVSYDTDLDLARSLIMEETMACPHRDPEAQDPWVRVIDHGEYAIELRLYMWCTSQDQAWQAKWWIFEMVKKRFCAEGVEIPVPYRTLVYKKDMLKPRRGEHDLTYRRRDSLPPGYVMHKPQTPRSRKKKRLALK